MSGNAGPMPPHRSGDRPPKQALPTTTPFNLPGRKTLSEHLPAEIIDVPLTLTQRSSYLRNVIAQQALEDPIQRPVNLPNVDSMGFRMYIEWLQTGCVEFHALAHVSSCNGLLLRDCFDLIFAHIAGSQLKEPDFQDYIIDTMARLLDASQTPDLKVLEVVFLEKGALNILKQFVVDRMFAVERKMLGMMRGLVGDIECTGDRKRRCEYHVHADGNCYRDRSKRGRRDARRVTNTTLRYGTNNADGGRNSLASSSSTTPYTKEMMHKMTDASYFASFEWSREVQSPRRRAPAPSLYVDKPLPTIPPWRSGSSPSTPSSPQVPKLPYVPPAYPASEAICTQQVIDECLSRLPASEPAPSSAPQTPSGSDQTAIPSLILECLERYKNSSLKSASFDATGSSEQSSPHSSLPLPMLFTPQHVLPQSPSPYFVPVAPEQHDSAAPPRVRMPSPPPPRQVRWEKSFDSLPKPQHHHSYQRSDNKIVLAPLPSLSLLPFKPPSQHVQSIHDQQFLPEPDFMSAHLICPVNIDQILSESPAFSHVKRKPAPPRGSDWLKQYDRVNVMQNRGPLVMAKRSRRSRIMEIFRSESGFGRAELER
jgi:hypothetical protein